LCYFIDRITFAATGYQFGYEMLMLNGLLTFTGLYLLSFGKSHSPKINIHEESAQK
jgi:hypothetical protein